MQGASMIQSGDLLDLKMLVVTEDPVAPPMKGEHHCQCSGQTHWSV